MSILIKGMEKPKECYCCPCSTINMNGRWGKCNLLGRDYSSYPHGIYEGCPLVEMPFDSEEKADAYYSEMAGFAEAVEMESGGNE